MSDEHLEESSSSPEDAETLSRRMFLRGMGKWSGAAIAAAVTGIFLGTGPRAQGAWINRRGGWINGAGGGGGGWINGRGGGGGWINRR